MQTVGGNEDGNSRLERDLVAIDFKVADSFQYIVNFSHLLMIVGATLLGDFHNMHGGDPVAVFDESSLGLTARTGSWLDFIKIRN